MDRRCRSRASSCGEAGLPADLAALDDLLAGIEAAPPGQDPDAWLELIGPDLPACADSCPARAPRGAAPAADRGTPDHADRLRAAARRPARARCRRLRPDAHRRAWQRVSAGLCRAGGLAHRLHRLGRAGRRADGRAPPCSATAATRCSSRRRSTRPCSSAGTRSTQPLSALAGGAPAGRARGSATIPGSPAAPSATGWRPSSRPRAAALVALDPNPVDAIWPDRPPPPIAPVRRHDERYAGESRRRQARADRGRGRQEGCRRAPADRRRFDRLAAQPARRRHRLQSAGAELCPAGRRRHLPLVRRSAQAAARPEPCPTPSRSSRSTVSTARWMQLGRAGARCWSTRLGPCRRSSSG